MLSKVSVKSLWDYVCWCCTDTISSEQVDGGFLRWWYTVIHTNFFFLLLWNRSKLLIVSWSAFLPNRNASCRRKRKETRNGNRKVHGWVLQHELNYDCSCLHLSNKLAVPSTIASTDYLNELLTLRPNLLVLQFILLLVMCVQFHIMHLYAPCRPWAMLYFFYVWTGPNQSHGWIFIIHAADSTVMLTLKARGVFMLGQQGTCLPRSTCCPQIQKLEKIF